MHVFHIKGFSGILLLILAIVSAIALFLLLPATFMMVLWNALIFEGIKGPEINLYQGFLIWGIVLVMVKLVFKPEIQLQFQKHASTPTKSNLPASKPESNATEAAKPEEAQASVNLEESSADN
jgi:hypothetical protein